MNSFFVLIRIQGVQSNYIVNTTTKPCQTVLLSIEIILNPQTLKLSHARETRRMSLFRHSGSPPKLMFLSSHLENLVEKDVSFNKNNTTYPFFQFSSHLKEYEILHSLKEIYKFFNINNVVFR